MLEAKRFHLYEHNVDYIRTHTTLNMYYKRVKNQKK